MKTIISLVIFGFSIQNIVGQNPNPFKSIGKPAPEILSLSNGKYPEIFENDTLRKIGSVMFNTRTNKIAYFIETDTMYSEATLRPEIVSRWLSRDPLARKYPSHSPYNFALNNPILFVDPDGQDVHLNFMSQEAKDAFVGILNMGLEGQYTATLTKADDSDMYQLTLTAMESGSRGGLSSNGQVLFDAFSEAIGDHNTVAEIDVYKNSNWVDIGNYADNRMDVGDMQKFSESGKGYEKTYGATQVGLLLHETYEQYLKAKDGIPKWEQVDAQGNETYPGHHSAATEKENGYNGVAETGQRQNDDGSRSMLFEDGTEVKVYRAENEPRNIDRVEQPAPKRKD